MAAYPIDFPFAEAANAVSIVKNGQITERKDELALDLWWVQGYAQAMYIGNPAAQSSDGADGAAELEKVVTSIQSGSVAAQISVNWKAIAAWAAKLLLEHLLASA